MVHAWLRELIGSFQHRKHKTKRSIKRPCSDRRRGYSECLEQRLLLTTLNALSDLTIDEDAAEQTVNLAGIAAGGGESQPLRVTATSDDTGLIPNPLVTYTSAELTGSLKFTPVADQVGTALRAPEAALTANQLYQALTEKLVPSSGAGQLF